MNDDVKDGRAAPEGAVIGEGPSLSEAIAQGASLLGVHPSLVQHRIDLSHFRNPETGRNMGVDTVKVWVWPKDQAAVQVVEQARAWMRELLEHMGLGGEVDADVRGDTVLLRVKTSAGGQLVGKQGATLDAVRSLLATTLGPEHPRYEFRLDVADPRREHGEGREDRGERRPRREHGEGRGERRPRREHAERRGDREPGYRAHDRGPSERPAGAEGERRERRPRRDQVEDGAQGEEANAARKRDVERLAHRLAKKVQESGAAELIRREMNSYERRLVHIVVAEYPGLATESVGEGALKQIRILPSQASSEAEAP